MGLKILYWNVYTGNNPHEVMPDLRQMIETWNPHIVGTGESDKITEALQTVKGYRKFTLDEIWTGRSDTAVLVRNDVDLRDWNWVKFTKWWVGPVNGWAQGPKRFWNGRVKIDGLGIVRVSIGHWPFNKALPEVERWAVDWFKAPALWFRKSVHIGDLNMGEWETKQFVKKFNGRTVGVNIDRAMFKRCNVAVRNLGHRDSDHPAVLFTVTNNPTVVKRMRIWLKERAERRG